MSLYSSDPLYSSITDKGELFTCNDAMVASCMGAPGTFGILATVRWMSRATGQSQIDDVT